MVFNAKNNYFCYKTVLEYTFSIYIFKTVSLFSNWCLNEFATLYYMLKGPNDGFKKPQNEEINQIHRYLNKKKILKRMSHSEKYVKY